MIDANSANLRAIMKAGVALGNQGSDKCWSRQFRGAVTGLDNEANYKQRLISYQRINMPMLHVDVRRRHQAVWKEVVGQDPSVAAKKAVTYHNWFALPMTPDTDPRV